MTESIRANNNEIHNQSNGYLLIPRVIVPLGVTMDWIPRIVTRTIIGFGQHASVDLGKLKGVRDVSLNPSLFGTLRAALERTSYDEKDLTPGVLNQKVVTIDPIVKDEKLVFGLWNSRYDGDYTLKISGNFDYYGRRVNVISFPMLIRKIDRGILGPETEGHDNPYFYVQMNQGGSQTPMIGLGSPVNIQPREFSVAYEIQAGKFTSKYGFLQTITRDLFTIRANYFNVGFDSGNRILLDVWPTGNAAIFGTQDVSAKDNKRVDFSDAPSAPVASYVGNPFDYEAANYAEYSLSFRSYLMMKADTSTLKEELGLSVQDSYWVPVESFDWWMTAPFTCVLHPCSTGLGPYEDPQWQAQDHPQPSTSTAEHLQAWDPPFWQRTSTPYNSAVGFDPFTPEGQALESRIAYLKYDPNLHDQPPDDFTNTLDLIDHGSDYSVDFST